jgi:uncharacterized protein (DUF433 family)
MKRAGNNMASVDWSQCPLVEVVPGKVSGAPLLKNTRLPVEAITGNYDALRDEGLSPDSAITETLDCYPGSRTRDDQSHSRLSRRSRISGPALKVLFDEDVPHKLARLLPRHEIHTVAGMQWGGIKNGELLTLIERERFNAFLTGDKNMPNQQRLADRPFGVLILSAINWPVVGHTPPRLTPTSSPPEPNAPSQHPY